MKKVLRILGCLAVAGVVIVIAPWVLVGVLWEADKASKDLEVRRYKPKDLGDAVAYKYATPEMVGGFINQGGNVNQRVAGSNGTTLPLVRVATQSRNVDVARLLLRRGAKVEEAGVWPVVRAGNEEMARMLLAEGASLGLQKDGDPELGPELLQAAALGHQAWLIPILVTKGRDPQLVNARGEGLLTLALEGEMTDSLETTRALLAAGAHAQPRDSKETPPLFWAARYNRVEEMNLLVAAGARVDATANQWIVKDVKLPDGAKLTAIGIATEYCQFEAVEWLLQHHASKATITPYGKPLVEGACFHILTSEKPQRDKMVQLLSRP